MVVVQGASGSMAAHLSSTSLLNATAESVAPTSTGFHIKATRSVKQRLRCGYVSRGRDGGKTD